MFFLTKYSTNIKHFLLINSIIVIKFYKFLLEWNYIKLKTFRIRIRPDLSFKKRFGSGRILIWKKIRIRFRPDSNLKKLSGSGSGRILTWKKSPDPGPDGPEIVGPVHHYSQVTVIVYELFSVEETFSFSFWVAHHQLVNIVKKLF